jgi:hypothetical protein
MKNIKTLILITAVALGVNVLGGPTSAVGQAAAPSPTYQSVNAIDMVVRPNFYQNKYVTVKGKFDKFSTLGLDYKPAFRSSDDYISFLIQRDDVQDHNVPLSELKIFMKRKEAEKYIDLNAGDVVEFSGRVFSNALGDVWMDVEKFMVLSKKTTKKV